MTHQEWILSIINNSGINIAYWDIYIFHNVNDKRYMEYFMETLIYNTDVLWQIALTS